MKNHKVREVNKFTVVLEYAERGTLNFYLIEVKISVSISISKRCGCGVISSRFALSHVAFSAPSSIERHSSLMKRQSSSADSTWIASDEKHASLFKRQSSKTASKKVAKSSNGEADLPMM
ncbi:1300_t:CDS:2 [Funneliformis caledonium]|uniref:1300_t:CDS:1 n=1 Tax=Funneliformis caledonium TaxID=1117310 RepID=A0A9N8ZNW4_9GLOM|nr:1300_t:CDS:2 [Funneliformis caledonium]